MPLSTITPAIKRCFNLEDFRRQAKHKLPAPLFHYIDGNSTRSSQGKIFTKITVKRAE
ncbi:MAG: hypothetical protein JKX92_10835 [Porticoccaceae bacterium]|nr:hypothetical protein [Porticoccaceae bacterium]